MPNAILQRAFHNDLRGEQVAAEERSFPTPASYHDDLRAALLFPPLEHFLEPRLHLVQRARAVAQLKHLRQPVLLNFREEDRAAGREDLQASRGDVAAHAVE